MKAFRVTVDGFGDPPMEVTKYAKSRGAARMATARDIVEAGWHDRVDAGLLLTIRRVVRAPELDEPGRQIDPAMTAAQREVMEHAIGEWTGRPGTEPYRNHYCDRVGAPHLLALIALGWMLEGRRINDGRDMVAIVTPEGFRALGLPAPPPGEVYR